MNYNTNYLCTYKCSDVFLESEVDDLSETDKEFVRNALYRNDILHIFDMDDFDETILNKKIDELYEIIKEDEILINMMKKYSEEITGSIDYKIGLMIMFSYDFLDITHPIISTFIKSGAKVS